MSKIYIVGTPIGNMKDITLRALETLKMVDVIACEDTRVTAKLLNYWEINKKLFSYNKNNEKNSADGLIKIVQEENLSVALVSDAGMPLISDPGFELVKKARENNIEIEIIPGVNAAITTLALSSLASTFVFLGFPKEKSKQRQDQLKEMTSEHAYIFYVAPHKLMSFLADIETIHQDNIEIFLAKELTKMFEKHFSGNVYKIKEELSSSSLKGEFTMVLKLKTIKKTKINKYAHFSKNNLI
ncbi:16S rRNA (cytidine(1402)-2'-O)-methyltransferase [Mycoplasmopsis columbina]|uniref:16S rRNA (cytidine(1402)-2'-O)-methyltransferase n=1 Tax=Mycoplasmopsis columbina TaxID=114881 RepID=UPI0004A6FB39|nr:16S rRNA (cytidine(1402)-2'-O)-methyltransferase [Mycoplasmopsis columbina]VEU76992.1 putative SAM-dependent methyltransferase [Mycoplasmopsis columbina]